MMCFRSSVDLRLACIPIRLSFHVRLGRSESRTVPGGRLVVVRDRPADLAADDHLGRVVAGNRLRGLVRRVVEASLVGLRRGGLALDGGPRLAAVRAEVGASFVRVAQRRQRAPRVRFLHRPEAVAAVAAVNDGSVARVRCRVAPAGVAGDHERFHAWDRAGEDAVVDLEHHPDARQHRIKGVIRRGQVDAEVVKSKHDKRNDPGTKVEP